MTRYLRVETNVYYMWDYVYMYNYVCTCIVTCCTVIYHAIATRHLNIIITITFTLTSRLPRRRTRSCEVAPKILVALFS